MGAGIGQSIQRLSAYRTGGGPRLSRPASDQAAVSFFQSENKQDDVAFFNQRSQEEPLRVGFGDGTVSIGTAVVRTLQGGVQNAQRMIPSVEEAQERVRTRLAEQRAQQEERTTELSYQPPRFANAAARVRDYVNVLNQTASTTQARLEGKEPPAASTAGEIQIGDQTFQFPNPVSGRGLNVLA